MTDDRPGTLPAAPSAPRSRTRLLLAARILLAVAAVCTAGWLFMAATSYARVPSSAVAGTVVSAGWLALLAWAAAVSRPSTRAWVVRLSGWLLLAAGLVTVAVLAVTQLVYVVYLVLVWASLVWTAAVLLLLAARTTAPPSRVRLIRAGFATVALFAVAGVAAVGAAGIVNVTTASRDFQALPALPAEGDPGLAQVAPTTPVDFSIVLDVKGEENARWEGYLDFGADPGGRDCVYDYTDGENHAVRALGGPSYVKAPGRGWPGDWASGVYRPGNVTLWVPSLALDDGYELGGADGVCALGLLPTMAHSTGQDSYQYDPAALNAYAQSSFVTMTEQFGDFLHFSPWQRAALAAHLQEEGFASMDSFVPDSPTVVTRSGETTTLVTELGQTPGVQTVTVTFTPTQKRTVASPEGAVPWWLLPVGDEEASIW